MRMMMTLNFKSYSLLSVVLCLCFPESSLQQQQQFGGQFINNALRGFTSIWSPAELLPNLYNNQQAPFVNSTPISVEIDLKIDSIRPASDQLSHYVDIVIALRWDDIRLQTPRSLAGSTRRIPLDRRWRDILWIPNIYFRSAAIDHATHPGQSSQDSYVSISNRTRVELTTYQRLQVFCSTQLSRFPFDEHQCNLEIVSLSETIDTLTLKWNSFEIDSNLSMLGSFHLSHSSSGTCLVNQTRGSFSCLHVALIMVRRIGSHLIARFLPTLLIVSFAFGSFWIPLTAYSARISIIMISFTMLLIHQTNLPVTSGLWALHVWYFHCSFAIFACLLEYLLALNESTDTKPSLNGHSNGNSSGPHPETPWYESKFFQSQPKMLKELLKPNETNNVFDMISRLAFPSFFLMTTFVYILFYAI